jgi:hypothetical protein
MSGLFGAMATVASAPGNFPAPPSSPPPEPPAYSRYRALRGKSVSSPKLRTFDVFCDDSSDGSSKSSSKSSGTNIPTSATTANTIGFGFGRGRIRDWRSESSDLVPVPIQAPLRWRSKSVIASTARDTNSSSSGASQFSAGTTSTTATTTTAGAENWSNPHSQPPPPSALLLGLASRKGSSGFGASAAEGHNGPFLPVPPIPTSVLATKSSNIVSPSPRSFKDGDFKNLEGPKLLVPSDAVHQKALKQQKQHQHQQQQDHESLDLSSPTVAPLCLAPAVPKSPAVIDGEDKQGQEKDQNSSPQSPQQTEESESAQGLQSPQPKNKKQEEDEAALYADEVARLEAENRRLIQEQKKLDLARLEATLQTPPQKLHRPRRIILDKLPFLSRSRKSNASSSQPGTPITSASTFFSLDLSRESSPGETSPTYLMSFIVQGGRGVVPQIDAPNSAVNGGERVRTPTGRT